MAKHLSNKKKSKNKEIIQRLNEVCEIIKLKQVDISKETGFTPGYISGVLGGNTDPSVKFLRIFSSAFEISLEWLRTGEGQMMKSPSSHEIQEITFLVPSKHVKDGDLALVWYSDQLKIKKVNFDDGNIALNDIDLPPGANILHTKNSKKSKHPNSAAVRKK